MTITWSQQHGAEYRLMVRELKTWWKLNPEEKEICRRATSGNLPSGLARQVDAIYSGYAAWRAIE